MEARAAVPPGFIREPDWGLPLTGVPGPCEPRESNPNPRAQPAHGFGPFLPHVIGFLCVGPRAQSHLDGGAQLPGSQPQAPRPGSGRLLRSVNEAGSVSSVLGAWVLQVSSSEGAGRELSSAGRNTGAVGF